MDNAHVEPIAPLLCAHCEAREARRWVELDAPDDPCCDTCFETYYFCCARCGRDVPISERVSVVVARQTRLDPAEYESWCENCAGVDDDPQGSRDDEGD